MPLLHSAAITRLRSAYICQQCLRRLQTRQPGPSLTRGIRTRPYEKRVKSHTGTAVPGARPPARPTRHADQYEWEGDTEELMKDEAVTEVQAMSSDMQQHEYHLRRARLESLRKMHGHVLSERDLLKVEAVLAAQEEDEVDDELREEGAEDLGQPELIAKFEEAALAMHQRLVDPDKQREMEEAEIAHMDREAQSVHEMNEKLRPIVEEVNAKSGKLTAEEIEGFRARLNEIYPNFAEHAEQFAKLDGSMDRAMTLQSEGRYLYPEAIEGDVRSTLVLPGRQDQKDTSAQDRMLDRPRELRIFPVQSGLGPHEYITRLNDAILAALRFKHASKGKPDEKHAETLENEVFRWYMLARNKLLSITSEDHEFAWRSLWDILCSPESYDRLARVNYLGTDMLQMGLSLTDDQQLVYIEAKYLHGDRDIALEEWKSAMQTIGQSADRKRKSAYWVLGVNICAERGQLELSFTALDRVLETEMHERVYRLIIPVIELVLGKKSEDGTQPHHQATQTAWALYARLKEKAGPNTMSIEDYDQLVLIFMAADRPTLALGVFLDLMLQRERSALGDKAPPVLPLIRNADGGTTAQTDLVPAWEQISVRIPARFNNKFFFAAWMKRLIIEEHLEAAKKVFDLAQSRGIRPDAHLKNCLIGGFLRRGTVQAREQGEALAWEMIEARIAFVRRRDRMDVSWLVPKIFRRAPEKDDQPSTATPANIETFALLVENYRRRQSDEMMDEVYEALQTAKIRPNMYFVNEMLAGDLREHKSKSAWNTYQHSKFNIGLRPDLQTFMTLWTLARHRWDPTKEATARAHGRGFPECRELFAEMMVYKGTLTARDAFAPQILDMMIQAFSVSDDQAGTAVAITACARYFRAYPNEEIVQRIVMQLAKVGHATVVGLRPRRLFFNKATKQRMTQVGRLLQTFKQQRVATLQERGIDYAALDEHEQGHEGVAILCDLLRYVAQMRLDRGRESGVSVFDSSAELSRDAAEEMGVPECDPWVEHGMSAL